MTKLDKYRAALQAAEAYIILLCERPSGRGRDLEQERMDAATRYQRLKSEAEGGEHD